MRYTHTLALCDIYMDIYVAAHRATQISANYSGVSWFQLFFFAISCIVVVMIIYDTKICENIFIWYEIETHSKTFMGNERNIDGLVNNEL